MILHLAHADAFAALAPDAPFVPASLADEGFVHACEEPATMLAIAERFYRDDPGPFVMLEIDEALLTSPVVREPAAHPDGSPVLPDDPRFPHVYGPIDRAAIVRAAPVRRAPDGGFIGW